ncbi:NAD(P)-binding domain-containing protein [Mycoplasma sp. CSL7475-4]|uniref:NAD(P)H-dependent glycerol-3-phosphate dehydrogenase n=1 Tax=Mycoplasma sp. CSL7475-4 TaxID=2973942 RepID=UPI00216AE243|nr:NAD(P)H-dependent glycerol-3-phosphate dehydrogenase [Mycoplasma sp. CSL7475-4]MCS4536942.1 NAD(P)-binding domain-containing protein [Mycoplasma sp. CSL7475-4]
MRKITFIGTGAWASGLATVLSKNNHKFIMWGIDNSEIEDINRGFNTKYFGNLKFNNPQNIIATDDLNYALKDSDLIILAIPTPAIATVVLKIKQILGDRKVDVINVSKGIDFNSKKFISNLIRDEFGNNLNNVASLIGPSFATEVFQNHLTMINVVGTNVDFLHEIEELFNNDTFKLKINTDEQGSEVFSALKNVLAIGIGIASYMHAPKNLAPALISQGLMEIHSVAKKMFPQTKDTTGYELAAVGDIVLTCLNTTSRNYSFGLSVGEHGVSESLKLNKKTVEGYNTAVILNNMQELLADLDIPFLKSIIDVLLNNKNKDKLLDFYWK